MNYWQSEDQVGGVPDAAEETARAAEETAAAEQEIEATIAEGGPAGEPSLVDELRILGRHLGAALRAAAATPEAETLKSEVRAGVQALDREVRQSAAETKETTTRVTAEYRESGSHRVRNDLAKALQALNRGLEQLATSIEPAEDEDEEEAEAEE